MKAMLIIALLASCCVMLTHTPFPFVIPRGFPPPVYPFEKNPVTRAGFELGRKLFYDGKLSIDGNFPCASCHQQFAAFATYEHRLSHGYNNQFSYRNAPALFNLAWQKEFHWDGGISNLEVQPLAPMLDPHEMAESLGHVISKLKQDKQYPALFNKAFGSPGINSQRILRALTQFTVSLVSANSKYDKVQRGEAVFTQYEKPGYEIFQQKCAACHKEPLFTDLSYRNAGLAADSTLKDYGRMRITGRKEDSLKFRVPSLRNVYLTFPYGHDGRFATLSDVLDHYSRGVTQSATLDTSLRKGIPLSDNDKFYLIQFLGTLTDTSFVNNPLFKDPGMENSNP
ncbi:MAG: cytochrome c peroxidase [Bacteroidota bacterium]|nr:cytochrome c peroxidase [Bacteroidota bacterium]